MENEALLMGTGKLAVYVFASEDFLCHGNCVTPMQIVHAKIVESTWSPPSLPSFLLLQCLKEAQRRKKKHARKKGILQGYQL